MPWLKKLLYIALLLAALIGIFFAWQVWKNNRDINPVPATDIEKHFNRSVQWLLDSYNTIENTQNPILWWMIKQAAETSGDKRLQTIYARYKQNHLDPNPNDLWTPMFNELYRPRVPERFLLPKLADYQLFFLYSLSCDRDLATEAVIQKQLQPGFCTMHYLHPRCVTHQMMGLRFMQRYQCGYEDTVNSTIGELQEVIISELTWDFRVTDAYIQRVLMLADSGAYNRIKPVWIRNILDAQNDDGSWDDLYPLFPLGGGRVFALTSMLPKIGTHHASFHATAQGIMLLALLLEHNRDQ